MKNSKIALFEGKKIRRVWDKKEEKWYFSVVDVVQLLIEQYDYQKARNYWNKLAERLRKEGSESVTKCQRLKLEAIDGKFYKTDVADTETLLRLIQSIPSKNAEPFKLWLARVGYERIEEINDPEKALRKIKFQQKKADELPKMHELNWKRKPEKKWSPVRTINCQEVIRRNIPLWNKLCKLIVQCLNA